MTLKVKTIFARLSDHLRLKFEMSAEVNHNGIRGSIREDTLLTFFSQGMLPKKFDIGSGEIISTSSGVSKQCDLVIYDSLNSAPLYFEPAAQVFPIEIVCGTIEIKSRLSKTKLVEGLDNIKSVKSLSKGNKPFGIIFAYDLGGNSLESLLTNLIEWEAANPAKKEWPDLIVVNGQGLIYHSNDDFSFTKDKEAALVTSRDLSKETFFSFYSILTGLLQDYEHEEYDMLDYYYMPTLIGDMLVQNHDSIAKDDKLYSLTEAFLSEIKNNLPDHVGQENIPYQFFFDTLAILKDRKFRVYNPTALDVTFKEEWRKNPEGFAEHLNYVVIDDFFIVYHMDILTAEHLEEIKIKTPEDL